jgi:zinc/manganese transport system substrate-binding protein
MLLSALVLARRRTLLAAALAVALTAAGCAAPGGSSDGRLDVVATTTQVADFVRAVGGDAVEVHPILRPNTDPHEYEPRPDDVRATGGADLVVVSGDGLDGWMSHVLDQSGADPGVVDLSRARLDRLPGDSHWWHDPRNVEAAIPVLRAALTRADPAHGAAFARNAAAYGARLRRLDHGIARCLARVPAARRALVTSHDAFGYFAERYGIQVIGAVIPSQTTEAQPSAGALARLSEQVRRHHVHAIFPESSASPKLAEALARQTGARSDLVLYGDTLGPAGSPGATYLGMERANALAMLEGFTGSDRGCRLPRG